MDPEQRLKLLQLAIDVAGAGRVTASAANEERDNPDPIARVEEAYKRLKALISA